MLYLLNCIINTQSNGAGLVETYGHQHIQTGDFCACRRSGIEVLPEVIGALKDEALREKLEVLLLLGRGCTACDQMHLTCDQATACQVWIDGGVRRGSDIFKALAMVSPCILISGAILDPCCWQGADAVGLGKPAVYAMSAYGHVRHPCPCSVRAVPLRFLLVALNNHACPRVHTLHSIIASHSKFIFLLVWL